MSFNIYDLSPIDPEQFNGDTQALEAVEMGLSSGELRQSLLDRLREEVESEDSFFINYSLRAFDLEINQEYLETATGRASTLEDIENALYEIEDESISDTTWLFSREIIYIAQEDE